jgi:hypothetical protein
VVLPFWPPITEKKTGGFWASMLKEAINNTMSKLARRMISKGDILQVKDNHYRRKWQRLYTNLS